MKPYHSIPEDLGNNLIAVSKHTAHNRYPIVLSNAVTQYAYNRASNQIALFDAQISPPSSHL
ncbi:MAG: hypothetical protein ACLFVO_18015 [Chloroflexaceae bacterium]